MKLAFMIERAEDLPDVWVAHCLSLGVVTQGATGSGCQGALQALLEATQIVIEEDIKAGLDPWSRRRAPPEDWARFERCFEWSYSHHAVPEECTQVRLGWLVADGQHVAEEFSVRCYEQYKDRTHATKADARDDHRGGRRG